MSGHEFNPIFKRTSVRDYLQKEIPGESIRNILKAAMQAPSAMNQRAWEFIVITDKLLKIRISRISKYSIAAKNAAAVILTLVNLTYLKTREEDKLWVQDLSASTENILLQTLQEGLGGVWLGIYPYPERMEKIRHDFMLPDYVEPFSAVALGYAAYETQAENRYDLKKVHVNFYGNYSNNDCLIRGDKGD